MKSKPYLIVAATALLPIMLFLLVDLNAGLLLIVALVGSVVVSSAGVGRWRGSALFLLPLFVALPWVTPRGDNDGLWVLVFPIVASCIPLMVVIEYLAGRVRKARRSAG